MVATIALTSPASVGQKGPKRDMHQQKELFFGNLEQRCEKASHHHRVIVVRVEHLRHAQS
jgi:hypothetical protein